ncbi:hypothetical protein ACEPAI_1249 [Sanghuangporus weigelae]
MPDSQPLEKSPPVSILKKEKSVVETGDASPKSDSPPNLSVHLESGVATPKSGPSPKSGSSPKPPSVASSKQHSSADSGSIRWSAATGLSKYSDEYRDLDSLTNNGRLAKDLVMQSARALDNAKKRQKYHPGKEIELYQKNLENAQILARIRNADLLSSRMETCIMQSQIDELRQSVSDLNTATFGGTKKVTKSLTDASPENAPIYRCQFVRDCQNCFYQGMSIFYKQYFKEHLLRRILQFSEYQEEQLQGLKELLEGFRCRDESVEYEFKDLNNESRTSPSPTFGGASSDKSQADSVSVSSTDAAAALKASWHVTILIPSQSTRSLDGKKLILDLGLEEKLDPMHLYKFNAYFTHNDSEFNLFWNKLCFNGKVLELTYTSPLTDEVVMKPFSWPNSMTLYEWGLCLLQFITELKKRAKDGGADLDDLGGKGRSIKFKQIVHLVNLVLKTQHEEESSGRAGSRVPRSKPSKEKQPAKTARSSKKDSVSGDKAYAMKKALDDANLCLFLVKNEKLLQCIIAAPFPIKEEGNQLAHPDAPDDVAKWKEFGRRMGLIESISEEEKNKVHRDALDTVSAFVGLQLNGELTDQFDELVPLKLKGRIDSGSQPSGGGKDEGQSRGESEGKVLVPEQPAGSIISGTSGAGKGKEVRFG